MNGIALTLLAFSFFQAAAQQNTVASGGDSFGMGGSASFSIGQIDYHMPLSENFSMLEGLQQPIEIVVLATTEFPTSNQIKIYPNPVFSGFYICVPLENVGLSQYSFFDTNGKMISNGKIIVENSFISAQNLTPGIYFLKVETSGKSNGYKIIKK